MGQFSWVVEKEEIYLLDISLVEEDLTGCKRDGRFIAFVVSGQHTEYVETNTLVYT